MTPARSRMGPEWTSAITTLSMVVTFAIVVGALYWAQAIFIPVALAFLMAFVLSPAVTWIQRRGAGRTFAVVFVNIFSIGLLLFVGTIIAQQMARLGASLPEYQPNITAKVEKAKSWILGTELFEAVAKIIAPESVKGVDPSPESPGGGPLDKPQETQKVQIESSSSPWISRARSVLSPTMEIIGTAAFANVLAIFMLLGREDLRNRMIRLIGHGRVTTTTKAVDDATTRISRYLLTQLALNAGFGLVMTLGLLIIGLPYPMLWGFIAFLMRYVPYIGTWISVIPPALFSFAISTGWAQPVAVLSLYLGTELICNNVLEPWLYGSSMGLSQVAQLIAAGFWAFLWGPIGLILSGPLTVCLLVLGKYVHRLEFLDILLGDEPALHPRVAFYQRLAARDQDEASAIALKHAKEKGPDAAFDEIVLPALSLAKRDHDSGGLDDADWDDALRASREVGEEVIALTWQKSAKEPAPELPAERIRLLLIPGRDSADLAAVEMLAHRLDATRWNAEVVPVDTLASELIERVQQFDPSALLIGSLLPGGVSHTRYLVTRLRARFPNLKIWIGRWGDSEELGEEREKAGIDGANGQQNSLTESLQHLNEWSAVFADAVEKDADEEDRIPKLLRIGTQAAPAASLV